MRGNRALMPDAHILLQGDPARLLHLIPQGRADDAALGDITTALRARAGEAGLPPLRAAGRMISDGLLMEWRAPVPVALIVLLALQDGSPAAATPPESRAPVSSREPQPACAGWQAGN
jgi:hypothetical protein